MININITTKQVKVVSIEITENFAKILISILGTNSVDSIKRIGRCSEEEAVNFEKLYWKLNEALKD